MSRCVDAAVLRAAARCDSASESLGGPARQARRLLFLASTKSFQSLRVKSGLLGEDTVTGPSPCAVTCTHRLISGHELNRKGILCSLLLWLETMTQLQLDLPGLPEHREVSLSVGSGNTGGFQADPNRARPQSAELATASCLAAPWRSQYGSGIKCQELNARHPPQGPSRQGAEPPRSPGLCMKHTKGQMGARGRPGVSGEAEWPAWGGLSFH